MADTVRWSLVISKETDIALRTYLAQRGMRKGDLSKFVEDAVEWRILGRAVGETKAAHRNVPPKEIEAAIAGAVRSVRARRSRA